MLEVKCDHQSLRLSNSDPDHLKKKKGKIPPETALHIFYKRKSETSPNFQSFHISLINPKLSNCFMASPNRNFRSARVKEGKSQRWMGDGTDARFWYILL